MQLQKLPGVAASLFCLLLCSCDPRPQQGAVVKPTDSIAENQPVVVPAKDTIYTNEGDSTIVLNNKEAFVKGHLSANKHRPVFTIGAKKGDTIIVTIKPLGKSGNVRIDQIKMPDGSLDGPFGDSLSYTMKLNGKLGFIIGENMMAGDSWTGYFILHLQVKQCR